MKGASLVLQRAGKFTSFLFQQQRRRTMQYLVDPPPVPCVPCVQKANGAILLFPVRRIYCVGRNYADHVKEMGGDAKKDAPVFFCKPANAVLYCPHDENGAAPATTMVYPLATENLHHEVELVLAIGKAGTQIPVEQATQHICAFGVGLDLTRRDQQAQAKAAGAPWDVAKALDQGAPIATLVTAATTLATDAKIWCTVNGQTRQEGQLDQMIWSNEEIIHHLSERFELFPGDLIYTGTPAGVGPLQVGDFVQAGIDGLPALELKLAARDA